MEDAAKKDFFPTVMETRIVDEKIYGFPMDVMPMAMYYSLKAFEDRWRSTCERSAHLRISLLSTQFATCYRSQFGASHRPPGAPTLGLFCEQLGVAFVDLGDLGHKMRPDRFCFLQLVKARNRHAVFTQVMTGAARVEVVKFVFRQSSRPITVGKKADAAKHKIQG